MNDMSVNKVAILCFLCDLMWAFGVQEEVHVIDRNTDLLWLISVKNELVN